MYSGDNLRESDEREWILIILLKEKSGALVAKVWWM